MAWLPLIALGVTAFAATNLDDALVLLLFFGDQRYRARHVFIGQAAGVGLLVALSLVVALAAVALPARAVGLLGLLPIAIGAKQLLDRWRGRHSETASADAPPLRAAGWRQAAAVAGVTLANGGDNVGVYVPLFATRPPAETGVILVVFATLLAAWTLGGYYLARHSAVAGRVQRVSGGLMPWVLIGLGIIILVERAFQ